MKIDKSNIFLYVFCTFLLAGGKIVFAARTSSATNSTERASSRKVTKTTKTSRTKKSSVSRDTRNSRSSISQENIIEVDNAQTNEVQQEIQPVVSTDTSSNVPVANVATTATTTSNATATATITNTQTTATQNQVINTTNVVETAVADNVSTEQENEIPDMSKDEDWEDFRLCMQQSCSGGDDQPNNVQCYKSLNFDNVFANCKLLVDSSKQEDFREYFTGPFLLQEQKEFCEGDYWSGKFDEKTKKCNLSVKYNRPAYSGKVYKCGAVSSTKTWSLDGKTYTCLGENFGASACYQDSPNVAAAQMQQITGIFTLATGAIAATASVVSTLKDVKTATLNVKNGDEYTNINITKDQIGDYVQKNDDGSLKTDNFGNYLVTEDAEKMGITSGMLSSANAKLSGTSKGLEATQAAVTSGLPTMTEGAAQIISGSIAKKEKGDRLYGTCVLPNGQVIPENSNITLSW